MDVITPVDRTLHAAEAQRKPRVKGSVVIAYFSKFQQKQTLLCCLPCVSACGWKIQAPAFRMSVLLLNLLMLFDKQTTECVHLQCKHELCYLLREIMTLKHCVQM